MSQLPEHNSSRPRCPAACTAALAACLISLALEFPLRAQTQHWNISGREKSQNLSSAAVNQLNKGLVDQALPLLVQATQAEPNDPLPFMLLGLALDIKGRYQESLDNLYKAHKNNPKLIETVLAIGLSQYLGHDYEKAVHSWERLSKQEQKTQNPKLHQIYSNLGFAAMRGGDFQGAEQNFREQLKLSPGSHLAYHGLAILHYLAGDLESAKRMAIQAETILPYPPVQLLLAELDYLQGNDTELQQRIKTIISATKKGNKIRSLTWMGFPKQYDFQWDPFLADDLDNVYFLQARSLSDPKAESRRRSFLKQGSIEKALARLQAGLASGGQNDFYLLRQGALLDLSQGDPKNAIEKFNRAQALCQGCRVDLLYSAKALSALGQVVQAKGLIFQYQQLVPNQRLSPSLQAIATAQEPSANQQETANQLQDSATAGDTVAGSQNQGTQSVQGTQGTAASQESKNAEPAKKPETGF